MYSQVTVINYLLIYPSNAKKNKKQNKKLIYL